MDYKERHRIERSVLYTILKYLNEIDFSGIANKNVLAMRYLMCNLIKLKTEQLERKIIKDGLIKK